MRALMVFPTALFVAALSAGCLFGGDDDEPPTATPQPATSTPTATTAAAETPTSEPTAEASPTTAGEPTYTVQAGDNLTLIAERFGTTVEELLVLNEITDPDVIEVGQVLKLPPGTVVD